MAKPGLQVNNRGRRPVERQKMRPWLIELLNNNKTDGLTWVNREQGTFRINWKHGARNGWNIDKDANVFEQYAIHTGRYTKDQHPNPKKWKANFRCALNSLGDVKEVKTEGTTRGNNAYRVFKFLEEKKKTIKRSRQHSVESDEDSGVESPTTTKKPTRSYTLRNKRRKKHLLKREIESSDSSDAAVDSPNVQPDVKEVSLPVPSKDTDATIEARVKTEYSDEQLGITSGTLPNHFCGFVMIRYGEKRVPSESKDDIHVTAYDEDESSDSDSDEESNDTLPSLFHSNPPTPSTSRQISLPEYSQLISTTECQMSDVNVMSHTFDQQGNLVIAAQVEIPGELSDQNPSQTTQLPLPVRDLMSHNSGYISQP